MSKKQKGPHRCLREEKLPENDFNISYEWERILEEENKKPWTRKTEADHPSSLGMCAGSNGCRRAIYYDRIGTPPKEQVPAHMRMIFSMGHALHDMVQAKIEDDFDDFKAEVKSEFPALKLYGHCDGIFAERDWILEIKTCSNDVFRKTVRPKKEHVWQVHCYMFCHDIPRCQLMYVNRANGSTRTFQVEFENDVWDRIVEIIEYVESFVEKGEPPPQEPSWFSCNSCKFNYTCNPDLDSK
jgi:CRISPR/Cas system-associated exonuclease Cas4 (RecB family)